MTERSEDSIDRVARTDTMLGWALGRRESRTATEEAPDRRVARRRARAVRVRADPHAARRHRRRGRRHGNARGRVAALIAATWFATRTSALSEIISGVAPRPTLYGLRWIGDSYNGVVPLAGLGGEPFKLRILGRYLSVEQALTALVRDQLIDDGLGFVGVSAACCALGVVAMAVPAPHAWLVYAARSPCRSAAWCSR